MNKPSEGSINPNPHALNVVTALYYLCGVGRITGAVVKAIKSKLAERMLSANVPILRHVETKQPFMFGGKWYAAKVIPTRPA